jgi:hypothetical protein
MQQGKSLRLNDFTTDLFHYCWYFMTIKLWKLVEESRTTLGFLPTLNTGLLTLIPKEEHASNAKNSDQ